MEDLVLERKLAGYHEGGVWGLRYGCRRWDCALFSGGEDGIFKAILLPEGKVIEGLMCDLQGMDFFWGGVNDGVDQVLEVQTCDKYKMVVVVTQSGCTYVEFN